LSTAYLATYGEHGLTRRDGDGDGDGLHYTSRLQFPASVKPNGPRIGATLLELQSPSRKGASLVDGIQEVKYSRYAKLRGMMLLHRNRGDR
jgi:hypothetical protein